MMMMMMMMMKNRSMVLIIIYLLVALQLLSLVTAARDLGQPPEQGTEASMNMNMKIGSSPPRCEYKCSGCTPCEPAQVPATSSGHASFMHLQYTNYKPEGWKCKCGPSFYAP